MARSGRRTDVTTDGFTEVFSAGSADGPVLYGVLFQGESSSSGGSAVTGAVTVEVTALNVETFDIAPGDTHPFSAYDRNSAIKRIRFKRAAGGVDGSITWRPMVG